MVNLKLLIDLHNKVVENLLDWWLVYFIIIFVVIAFSVIMLNKKIRKKIDWKLLFVILVVHNIILFIDLLSTIKCIKIYNTYEIEANLMMRWLMYKLGDWAYVISYYSYTFVTLCCLVTTYYPVIKAKKEKRKYYKYFKMGFYVLWVLLLLNYLYIPIHNYKIC